MAEQTHVFIPTMGEIIIPRVGQIIQEPDIIRFFKLSGNFRVFICFSQIIRLHQISRCNAPAPILLRRIGPMRNVNLDFKNYLNTDLLASELLASGKKKC